MSPRRHRRLALAALLTAGVTALLAHEGHATLPTSGVQVDADRGALALAARARDAVDVRTAEVEARPVAERVPAYATLVAPWRNHGYAAARLPGRVVRLLVTPGQVVRAGDPVAEVQSLELDALQLEVLAAQNDLRLSEKVAGELKRSAGTGAVTGQSLLAAESKILQDRTALAVARAKWAGLGLPADRLGELLARGAPLPGLTLPVRSPVSGVVTRTPAPVGKVVEPAEHLAEVVDPSTVWVRLDVLEKDLSRVRAGQEVELHLAAYPGEVFRARVKAVGLALDPVTHVNAAWAELANPSGGVPRFLPGMAGRAELILPADKPRATVPASAVIREGAERFVLVEEADRAGGAEYRKEPVVVGRRDGGRVELLAGGVFRGDRVVTQGADLLGDLFAPSVLRPTPEAARTIGLKVEPARKQAVDEVIELDGLVELPPDRRGAVASPLTGVLQAVHADPGQTVKAGDVLAEVFSVELQTMQLDLLRAHLEHRLASETLARLRGAENASRQRVWELESRTVALRNQIDTLRQKLTTTGLIGDQIARLLDKEELVPTLAVRAPVGGVVVGSDKVLGQAVAAHEPLFEVHDPTGAVVRGLVPERVLGRVRVGQAVRVRLVADPAFAGTGRVVRRGGAFGADARDTFVWVELDAPPNQPLRHNQLAGLAVVLGQRPPAVAVPRSAVVMDGSAAFVFVRRPDGAFDRRAVELGPADDRLVAITRGLAEGEPVAVQGAAELMTAYASLR